MIFRKETNEQIRKRLLNDVFERSGDKDFGAVWCDPEKAINELRRYFLGEDWYVVDPLSADQIIAIIVYEIELLYPGIEDKFWYRKKKKAEKREAKKKVKVFDD